MIGRIKITFFGLLLVFLLIIFRLSHWQIIKAEELSFLGNSQYGNLRKILPQRGEIKTSDGFSLVANKLSYLVFANPKEVKDKNKISTLLADILEIEKASVSALLSLDRMWVPVKSNTDEETKRKIEELKLTGIGFDQRSTRFYPEASLAAQIIGFVGKDTFGEDKGYFGLEGYYDRQLSGKAGLAVEIHDALGRPILSHINESARAIDGRSLILNIDRSIQFLAEEKLKEGIENYGAQGGMVGILEPYTGNILAMASYPSFDQRNYTEYPENLFKNPFISNIYEPGSTFKPIVMAGALDAKILKPETKCPICGGHVTVGDYQIKTWNDKYYKDSTMIEIIEHSDNTGMVYVAKSLGLKRFISYLDKFNFGNPTGIDLQGEVSFDIKAQDGWYPIDLATAGFGQGISVTPIQLLVAFSALANGGNIMEPHVVAKISDNNGEIISIRPKILKKSISSQIAKVLTEMLVNAVDKGEAKWAKPKGYRIAGKTGTAQIPIAGHYDPNKTITSFIGFAPADNPKFAMLVIIDRPTTSIYGAETAAPVFFDIAKDILTYYKIAPTEQ